MDIHADAGNVNLGFSVHYTLRDVSFEPSRSYLPYLSIGKNCEFIFRVYKLIIYMCLL